eukprot:1179149-Prorocentrum_minimum.AAC.2
MPHATPERPTCTHRELSPLSIVGVHDDDDDDDDADLDRPIWDDDDDDADADDADDDDDKAAGHRPTVAHGADDVPAQRPIGAPVTADVAAPPPLATRAAEAASERQPVQPVQPVGKPGPPLALQV